MTSLLILVEGKDGATIGIDPNKVTAIESYVVRDGKYGTSNTYSKVFVSGQHVLICTMDAAELIDEVNAQRQVPGCASGCACAQIEGA